MPFKNKLIRILSLSFILAACTSINYQLRDNALEGYSDKRLAEDEFEVSFQTYRSGNHLPEIKQLALKRATEISQTYHKPFFIVRSEKHETSKELVTIPEQKMLSFSGTNSGSLSSGTGYQEVETIIPAHNKEFTIQKVILTIQLLSNDEEGAISTFKN